MDTKSRPKHLMSIMSEFAVMYQSIYGDIAVIVSDLDNQSETQRKYLSDEGLQEYFQIRFLGVRLTLWT